MVFDAGSLFIADSGNNVVRKLTPSGTITTVAGYYYYNNYYVPTYGGDGGPATSAVLNGPTGVSFDASGNLYIADTYNQVIREVALLVPVPVPLPAVTSLSPSSATAGGAAFTLTINGTNFIPAAVATWGTTALTTTYVSATELTAAVPATLIATAGTASVTVTTSGGTSSAATFTIIPNPTSPTISSLSPSSATAGGAAFTLTVSGTKFVSGAKVNWDTTALTTTYVSATELTAAVPATLIATAGTASVTVTTSAGTSNSLAFTVRGALLFVPMTPCRVADTRSATGPFGGPSIAGETSRSFVIPGSACAVPSTAAAYSINVTVVPQAGLGYLTVWPTGVTQPVVSILNSDGRVKANAAIVPAGTSGAISVYATNTTDVVLDINGYFVPATSTTALAFYPLTPCRVADTRDATGSLGGPSLVGMQARAFPLLSSACNIPSSAKAYSLNFTALPQSGLGYLSAYPAGQTWPGVSTLNVSPNNPVVANAAIVPAGTGGVINVLGSNNTDVVIDINGYFAPVGSAGGQSLFTVTPCRVLDTRSSSGSSNGTLPVNVTSSSCGVPSSAEAFVLNATVVPTWGLGYLTLWPENEAQPVVSTLNADDGVIASNMAIVPTTNGSIDAFSSNSTQLILDISGYFAPSSRQVRVTANSAANERDIVACGCGFGSARIEELPLQDYLKPKKRWRKCFDVSVLVPRHRNSRRNE